MSSTGTAGTSAASAARSTTPSARTTEASAPADTAIDSSAPTSSQPSRRYGAGEVRNRVAITAPRARAGEELGQQAARQAGAAQLGCDHDPRDPGCRHEPAAEPVPLLAVGRLRHQTPVAKDPERDAAGPLIVPACRRLTIGSERESRQLPRRARVVDLQRAQLVWHVHILARLHTQRGAAPPRTIAPASAVAVLQRTIAAPSSKRIPSSTWISRTVAAGSAASRRPEP